MPEMDFITADEQFTQEEPVTAAPQRRQEEKTSGQVQPLSFDAIKIGLASPEKIREWSKGAVTKPETINYRTLKPERDGLYCERIFGPSKDWECHCGKYKKIRYKGIVCDRCGVEVTKSSVRRERMGHIELAAPVSHIWYFKGIPSRMGLILDLSPRALDKILYFASYVVLDSGNTSLAYKQVLTEKEYRDAVDEFGYGSFRAAMGAEAVKELLQAIDLEKESVEMRAQLETASGQKRAKLIKRLEVVESFLSSGNKPEWMILDAVPVLPPDLRPMVQLDGGRFATSDINDLYRRIINRNNRLARLLDLGAPEIIVRNEKRMLQEAVDALIDNGRRGRAVTGPGNRALKSLSDMLKGKQGRFRQNLLGKRVDYSGRSVIAVGPSLKIYQCGLPKEMAVELFKPFVMKELVARGIAQNVKSAKKKVERMQPEVWDVLEDVIHEHPVMLNRAPTLHRLGIQAFEPILVEGKAIRLHPLVCTAFNADFDGDQMAVHLPLSVEAQSECRFMLLSSNNLLKPADGGPVAVPSQDMVLGIYYLTMSKDRDYTGTEREGEAVAEFASKEAALEAYRAYQIAKAEGNAEGLTPINRETMIRVDVQDKKEKYVVCTYQDASLHRNVNYEGKEDSASKKACEEVVAEFATMDEASAAYHAYQAAKASGNTEGLTPINNNTMIRVNIEPVRYRWVVCTIEDLLGHTFANKNQALLAYENGAITLHQKIYVGVSRTMDDGTVRTERVECTLGRLIFNEIIPQDLGFQDRTDPDKALVPEIDFHVGKKQLKKILEKVINIHGSTRTAEVLDDVKAMGYKYSTIAALTVSVSDMTMPQRKAELIEEAQKTVDQIARKHRRGLSTEEERYKEVITTWDATDKAIQAELLSGLDRYNNIFMMADSGARGSNQQIKQLAGMRGLMADTTGHTIELPIKSNLREGLDVLEYFISAHGARKGMSDTALRTADSGYLTRRLVDVSQDQIVREVDCCADKIARKGDDAIPYMEIATFREGKEIIEELQERITGRYLAETIVDPDTGEVIARANRMVTPKRAEKIMDALKRAGRDTIKIRTVLSCRSHIGVCAKCYGSNMATGQPVQVGESIGIIAAQSIGEPGTQLTMRTFHTGGVAGGDSGNGDITQGLPRVEELFEARKPKGLAIISEIDGTVEIRDNKKKHEVVITNDEGESKVYLIPYGSRTKVTEGQTVEAGQELTEGSINPHDLLRIRGVRAVQDYMLREVQRVYRLQGVEINDKHIEVIVRQMLKKIRVEESGDGDVIAGITMDTLDFDDMNEALIEEGKTPAEGKQIMLGITKASLATDSFLSAASFQETTRVLTDAAINGRVDNLVGLKENVIIGKLIPAGTGMKRYRDTGLSTDALIAERKEAQAAAARAAMEIAAEEEAAAAAEEAEVQTEAEELVVVEEVTE